MRKSTLFISFLFMFYMTTASADQESCNADAKDALNSCLKSTKDGNEKRNCLSTYYVEVAKCAYQQKEENDRSKND